MTALVSKVDHSRVVQLVRKMNNLPLVKPYLQSIQDKNITAVNDALNELYIEEEDYQSLRNSIDHFDSFDAIKLAQSIEKHELLEFRRVSAYIYKKNQRWQQSVELSKIDKMYKDAIETAAESKKQDIAESLLEFFVNNDLKECFSACLYTCYDVIRPDVALELAWRKKIIDFAFPYLIQVLREYTTKVDVLYKELDKKKKDEDRKEPNSFSADSPIMNNAQFVSSVPQIAYYPANSPEMMNANMMNMGVNMNMGYGGSFQQPPFGM